MVKKKVLKSEVDRKREIAEDAMERLRKRRGDTRTPEQRHEAVMRLLYYTPEEARWEIECILAEEDEYVAVDGGDGRLRFRSKAERIAEIRDSVRE